MIGSFSALAVAIDSEMIPVLSALNYVLVLVQPYQAKVIGNLPAGGHCGCLCLAARPFPQLLEASDNVLKGLLPFRFRPYRPLPEPDIP